MHPERRCLRQPLLPIHPPRSALPFVPDPPLPTLRHMLCDRLLPITTATSHIDDHVDVDWWDLDRRAFRKTTRSNQPIRILLPLGLFLHDGALLTNESHSPVFQIHLRETEVLVISPRTEAELANLCLELGNLHAPTEF